MDSLTQITLGAAVGEVVLGKKAGNRAMMWGAVAGTIPDLDVLSNLFVDDIQALAIHRGFSHSIVFAIITAPIFGWLVYRFYQSGLDRSKIYKGSLTGIGVLLYLSIFVLAVMMPVIRGNTPGLMSSSIILAIGVLLVALLWRYYSREWSDIGQNITWREWSWLFFWGVFTHPLLDSLTSYGTQLFLPFSDYRVALNVISVADPLYTFPFLIFLIIACCMTRATPRRALMNWLGIALSSLYMMYCTYNKFRVNSAFKASLQQAEIPYIRYTTGPLIFNNVLWNGTAETADAYYTGMYSINDKRPYIKFRKIPKNHELLEPYEDTYEVKTLKWFSNNYFNVMEYANCDLVLNDLRYGSMNAINEDENEEPRYVFKFNLMERNGRLRVSENREMREDAMDGEGESIGDAIKDMWERGKGI